LPRNSDKRITITTLVIAAMFFAFELLLLKLAQKLWWIGLPIGIPTIFGSYFGMIAFHRHHQRRGPVLIFNSVQKRFELPHEKATLPSAKIDKAVLVCDQSGDGDIWQLQLWDIDGKRYRLITAFTEKELKPMASAIYNRAQVPVRVYVCESPTKAIWREEPFVAI
jgi:hypothetical protein